MPARLFTPRASPVAAEINAAAEPPQAIRRGREAAALLLFAAAAFLVLGLGGLKLDPHDPRVAGTNWVGPVGASVAGVLAVGFGVVAWLIPIELGLLGTPLLRGRSHGALGLRIAGDLLVAIV